MAKKDAGGGIERYLRAEFSREEPKTLSDVAFEMDQWILWQNGELKILEMKMSDDADRLISPPLGRNADK